MEKPANFVIAEAEGEISRPLGKSEGEMIRLGLSDGVGLFRATTSGVAVGATISSVGVGLSREGVSSAVGAAETCTGVGEHPLRHGVGPVDGLEVGGIEESPGVGVSGPLIVTKESVGAVKISLPLSLATTSVSPKLFE